jgi:hypothetical protein
MDVLLHDLVPHLKQGTSERDKDFTDRVRDSFKEAGGYNAHNILRFWRPNGMKNAFKEWGLEGLGLELDEDYSTTQNEMSPDSKPSFAFFQMRLRIQTLSGNATDEHNPMNYISIRYESGLDASGKSVSQLSVQSPLFGQNPEVTVKCLEAMQNLMNRTGDKNLRFDLDDYLKNPETLALMRTLFQDRANEGLLDRVSFGDLQKLGLGPAPKATFSRPGMMAHASPPAPVVISAPPAFEDSEYASRADGDDHSDIRNPFLLSQEVQSVAGSALVANSFVRVEGQPQDSLGNDLLGLHKKDDLYVVARGWPNNSTEMGFWNLLTANQSQFSQRPCSILGMMLVGHSANHYVSVCVTVDHSNKVSVKVADSLNGIYLDGKAAETSGAPFNDFEAIKAGARNFAAAIGGTFHEPASHQDLLADRSVVFKQPDHVSCGLYAVRNLCGLAGISAPVGAIGGLRSDTTQPEASRDSEGSADIQQNARDVLSAFTGDLGTGVTGPQLARLWWEGSHVLNTDARVVAAKRADEAAARPRLDSSSSTHSV